MRTFFDDLCRREHGFLIHNDCLYAPYAGLGDLYFKGQPYIIGQGSPLFAIEDSYLRLQQRAIMHRFNRRKMLLKGRKATHPESLDTCVRDYYYSFFSKQSVQRRQIEFNDVSYSLDTVLERTGSFFSRVFADTCFVHKDNVYTLSHAQSKNTIELDDARYTLSYSRKSNRLAQQYKSALEKHIATHVTTYEKKSVTHTKSGTPIQHNKKYGTITNAGYSKWCLLIPPYRLAHNQDTYQFPAVGITLNTQVRNNTLAILNAPHAPQGYHHPVVFSSGEICFNGTRRWGQLGIHFGTYYPFSEAAYKIALCLNEAYKVLTTYFGSVQKVHTLHRSTFSKEYVAKV